MKQWVIAGVSAMIAIGGCIAAASPSQERANIVLILADDLGCGRDLTPAPGVGSRCYSPRPTRTIAMMPDLIAAGSSGQASITSFGSASTT